MKLIDYAASRNISDEEAKKAAEATGQSTHPNAKNMDVAKLDAHLGIQAPATGEQQQEQPEPESQTTVQQDDPPVAKSHDDDEPPLEDPAGKKRPTPSVRPSVQSVRPQVTPQPVTAQLRQPTHIGQFEPGMRMYLVTARTSRIAALPQTPQRCCGYDAAQAQANLLKHYNLDNASSITWQTVIDPSFQHIIE